MMTGEARQAAFEEIRQFALSLPQAEEDFPWGERVFKVNKKIFVFFGSNSDDPNIERYVGVKLPYSGDAVLNLPFATAMGYNLGKHGWVSLRFPPDEMPPVSLIRDWITESYRAIAPKKLLVLLG
ncbi:MAG: MmcQ/YjbR family DNA-binding protein [Anaerolineae bacterium]